MKTSLLIAAALAAVLAAPAVAQADTTVVVTPKPAPPPPEPSTTGAVIVTPGQPATPAVSTCRETTTKTEDLAGTTTEKTRTCVDSTAPQ